MRLRARSFPVLVLVSVLHAAAARAQESFTLQQVLGAPFPSDLVAAPSGGRVAWVFDARGVRNVWIAEAPDYRARELTSYTADDGQEISDLAFAPDGASIVYVRGGRKNRRGEYPDPLSLPGGVKQQVWSIPVAGGEPRLLGEGDSPAVSPTGDIVAFLKGGEIWSAPVDGSAEAKSLVKVRGGSGSLRWSPDGSKLAFVSRRGDHSFVGVYDRGTERVSWIDPSVFRDEEPVWSPDGRSIAFIRIAALPPRVIFTPQRSGVPWSIRVVDVGTGVGREVWKAEEGVGSVFRGVVAENSLFWGDGGRLVFPWERSGWLHLYAVSVDGGRPTELTPGGEFEVEFVALSADGKRVIYNSNQGDIDRRHLWSVPVVGGTPRALTSGKGIEWAPTPTADGSAIALLRSDARFPARPAVLIGSGEPQDLAPAAIPSDFPASQLVEPRQVILSAADGLQIHGQLFLPSNARAGARHPAVVFFHGGSRRQMLLGWHYMYYYHNAYALNQYLASRGYVVLSVNYRSGIGYGMEFREAKNYGAGGGSEFNDVMGAGLYLRSRSDVDPNRIGLWGGSYGGYLTAMGLSRASDLFAAGVDLHGVHDWNAVIQNFVPSYNPLEHPDAARTARESSPVASLDTWRSPVLLIQGDDDRNVPFSETVDLAHELRKRSVEVEELVFPDEVHDFLRYANWLRAYQAAAAFFNAHLKAGG